MTTHENTCGKCFWYIGYLTGECRKNAPVALKHMGREWPKVGEGEWCGEFLSIAQVERDREDRKRLLARLEAET